MAKSRRPAKRRSAASATRRKSTTKRAARKPKAKAKPRGLTGPSASGQIELSPIRADIKRALAAIRALPQTEKTKVTSERLQRAEIEFDDICDPENPFGCGPNMAFPDPNQNQ